MCPNASATYAARLRRWAFGGKVDGPTSRKASGDTCPTAKSMNLTPSSVGTDLTARAYRLHNRNREAAERYLAVHRALGREV